MTKEKTNIELKVEWLLFESGMSQIEIANKSGIAQSVVSRLTNGKRQLDCVRWTTMLKLYRLAEEQM